MEDIGNVFNDIKAQEGRSYLFCKRQMVFLVTKIGNDYERSLAILLRSDGRIHFNWVIMPEVCEHRIKMGEYTLVQSEIST